jgi:hypothetical protein
VRDSGLMLVSVLVAGLAVPATAHAARVDGQVPFEFTVGSTALPAGHYQVRFERPERGIVTVRNVDTGKVVLVEYLARIESKEDGKSLLVFDEIEGQHVLRAIYVAGQEGYRLPAAGKQAHTH